MIITEQHNILLVEDDPLLIDIYSTKFKEAGFKVQVAENGEKALEAVKKAKPDLMVLDIVLPHLDGWGLLEALQQDKKLAGNAKIIVLSNLGQKEEIERGLSLGAARYLIKAHYTPSQVVAEVRKLLLENTS
mgnify:CR=1 FL=1|jgi:DNA-binding response OmpR family regulator|tara:strand:- start:2986 stop:3381 length:396 start_codon:yes stop_codon:yes gene_type:complete